MWKRTPKSILPVKRKNQPTTLLKTIQTWIASAKTKEKQNAKLARVEIKVMKRPGMPYTLNNPEWLRYISCVSYFHDKKSCRVLC